MKCSQKLNSHRIFKQLAKALISLRVCAGWSEPLLVAHTTLLEISCLGSYVEHDMTMSKIPFLSLLSLKRMSKSIFDFFLKIYIANKSADNNVF